MFRLERLVELRKKKNLTQEALAFKVSTTKGTISNYENGYSAPPNETLVAIADVLNTTTDYLLGRTDNSLVDKHTLNDEDAEFEAFMNNPNHGNFFKEYLDAPEERKQKLMEYWTTLKDAEKGRQCKEHSDE